MEKKRDYLKEEKELYLPKSEPSIIDVAKDGFYNDRRRGRSQRVRKNEERLMKKKRNDYIEKAVFGEITEGLCCQMMQIGSYDDEPASFEKMAASCEKNAYARKSKAHREIYMSDPRRTESSKLKTVLRFQIEKL